MTLTTSAQTNPAQISRLLIANRGEIAVRIALAFLPPTIAEGTAVSIDVRGSHLAGTVVPLPFVAKH